MPIISVDHLTDISLETFDRAGVEPEQAQLVTRLLIKANLSGHDSHGVVRIPSYISGIRSKQIRPNAPLQIGNQTATSAQVDGHHCFGQVVLTRAAELARQKSLQAPLSLITATNYSHCGQLGAYAEQISSADQIGIVIIGRSAGAVVPYGGRTGRLYQSTLAISTPSNKAFPIVLDMATSVAPFGKILMKRTRNESCPDGWLIDPQGQPVTDPQVDLSNGEAGLLPLGGITSGQKGSGLTFMLNLLAITLANVEEQVEGALIIAINPAFFLPLSDLKSAADGLVDRLHQTPAIDGFNSVLVPGERSYQETKRRRQEGILVENDTWNKLQELAKGSVI